MYETRRLVEAASALSALLHARGVPHAFYGDVLISLLANRPLAAVRSFVAGRRTFLTLYSPSKFHASCKVGPHTRSGSFATPSALRKISQPPHRLGLIGAKQLLPPSGFGPHLRCCFKATRKIPPLYSPNRSRSGHVYSPARTYSYPGFYDEIEILSAGEEGPRRLDANTIMNIRGIPFLSISEYIRAKLKSWAM